MMAPPLGTLAGLVELVPARRAPALAELGGLWLPPGWRPLSVRNQGSWTFRHGAAGGGFILDDLDARAVVLTAWELWAEAGGMERGELPLPRSWTAVNIAPDSAGASWRLVAPGEAAPPGPLPEQLREVWTRHRRTRFELLVGVAITALGVLLGVLLGLIRVWGLA